MPGLLETKPTSSALAFAISSLGEVAIAARTRSTTARIEGEVHYASTLRLVNLDLCDTTKATTDQTLMTVLLLGLYEVKAMVDNPMA